MPHTVSSPRGAISASGSMIRSSPPRMSRRRRKNGASRSTPSPSHSGVPSTSEYSPLRACSSAWKNTSRQFAGATLIVLTPSGE